MEKTQTVSSLRYRMTGRMPEDRRARADGVVCAKPPTASARLPSSAPATD
ncbi:hypothetical protein [Streptomyces sp. NPDC001435]